MGLGEASQKLVYTGIVGLSSQGACWETSTQNGTGQSSVRGLMKICWGTEKVLVYLSLCQCGTEREEKREREMERERNGEREREQ